MTILTRRSLLEASLGLVVAPLVGGATASSAQAAAPPARKQAPGFYRMTVGDLEVTALSDGTLPLPLEKLFNNTTPAHILDVLRSSFLQTPVDISVNAYLFKIETRLVLVDAGTGNLLGPGLGQLTTNLNASGYEPEQIDDIILTHIHGDHSGGLVIDGRMAFPKARVHVSKREADYWLSPANAEGATGPQRKQFDEAVASLSPYRHAGRFLTFADNAEPIPGFGSILRPGHTPGHSSIVVESRGEKFVVWGDITHGETVQFDEPEIAIDFDVDSKVASATRRRAFAEAAEQGYWVAGAHLPFPGIGHVRADGTGHEWIPMNYKAGTTL